jgi:hypothetical protein
MSIVPTAERSSARLRASSAAPDVDACGHRLDHARPSFSAGSSWVIGSPSKRAVPSQRIWKRRPEVCVETRIVLTAPTTSSADLWHRGSGRAERQVDRRGRAIDWTSAGPSALTVRSFGMTGERSAADVASWRFRQVPRRRRQPFLPPRWSRKGLPMRARIASG